MGALQQKHDPLLGGFYTIREAARLLQIESYARLYGWLGGYSQSAAGPVLARDYEPMGGVHAISFWDLMEVRFLEHFRKQEVPLQTLRKAAVNARREMKAKHPFALSNVRFLTDRRTVFLHTAEEMGDKKTLNLVNNQFEIYEAIENVVAKGVSFDPATGLAESWRPVAEYPDVIVDPRFAFGRPTISRVPTSALFRQWRAESGDKARVARSYGVKESLVAEAVEFELRLAAA